MSKSRTLLKCIFYKCVLGQTETEKLSDMAQPLEVLCRSLSEGQHVTYISWLSDFTLYLEDYLMYNESV